MLYIIGVDDSVTPYYAQDPGCLSEQGYGCLKKWPKSLYNYFKVYCQLTSMTEPIKGEPEEITSTITEAAV